AARPSTIAPTVLIPPEKGSWDQEHERHAHEQKPKDERYRPAGKALLKAGSDRDTDDARSSQQEPIADVHVSVGSLCACRESGDHCDRGQRGPGRLVLSVAEPKHQERNDHGSSTDTQKRAESAGGRSDCGQPRSAVAEHGRAY